MIARASSGRGAAITDQIVGQVRKLPSELWPIIQSHWCDPKCFEGMARYLEALPESAAEVGNLAVRPGIPLIALTPEPGANPGHGTQPDRPDVVIQSIFKIKEKLSLTPARPPRRYFRYSRHHWTS